MLGVASATRVTSGVNCRIIHIETTAGRGCYLLLLSILPNNFKSLPKSEYLGVDI
jgi:hypothetical protein